MSEVCVRLKIVNRFLHLLAYNRGVSIIDKLSFEKNINI